MKLFAGIPDDLEHARVVPLGVGDQFVTVKRDRVEPVPVGTLVAFVFRVTGFDPDCDGSLMVRAEQIDSSGESTGWEIDSIGLSAGDVLLDRPDELVRLVADHGPAHETER